MEVYMIEQWQVPEYLTLNDYDGPGATSTNDPSLIARPSIWERRRTMRLKKHDKNKNKYSSLKKSKGTSKLVKINSLPVTEL